LQTAHFIGFATKLKAFATLLITLPCALRPPLHHAFFSKISFTKSTIFKSMKTSFFSTILFIIASFFASNAAAQNDNQASFESFLKKVYTTFSTDGFQAMKPYYTENAIEIGPDGGLINGQKAIGEYYAQLEGMMDAKPQFTIQLTSWRLIKPDVALITWDSHDKFFLFGQTMESDNTGAALLRKEKGQWLIEYDHMTPKVPFPDPKADELAIKALGNEAYAAFAAHDAARFAACYTEDTQT
jgi:ketosteroid isomerase-like protein